MNTIRSAKSIKNNKYPNISNLKTKREFANLHARYEKKVYSLCIKLLKEEGLAKDATQEIFIRVYLNAHQFQKNSKFSTWLYAIAHNYCMDVLRKKKKQDLHLCDDMSMASDVAVEQNDPSQMEAQKAALKAIMRKLPPKDRQILTMRFQENMSIEEIARVMKKSEGAVKMKISRAKAKAKALRTRIN